MRKKVDKMKRERELEEEERQSTRKEEDRDRREHGNACLIKFTPALAYMVHPSFFYTQCLDISNAHTAWDEDALSAAHPGRYTTAN